MLDEERKRRWFQKAGVVGVSCALALHQHIALLREEGMFSAWMLTCSGRKKICLLLPQSVCPCASVFQVTMGRLRQLTNLPMTKSGDANINEAELLALKDVSV